MRSSMLSGSPARTRSTDSIAPASAVMVLVPLTATSHHPLALIEHRSHIVLRARLGVHSDERLGSRKAHEELGVGCVELIPRVRRIRARELTRQRSCAL